MNRVSQTLGQLRGGLVDIQISAAENKLLEAIRRSGKKGKLTITLTYDPKGSENTEVHVSAKFAVNAPADPGINDPSIFFLNNDNHLVRQSQEQLGLRGIDKDDIPVADRGSRAAI